ncbi:Bug family tripartite tricarboxylate transporter substrate binding protein [Pacificoceanicola onchidii]|uniref:Bug family tripartite tricarboxylate transporter substrate binding protein n=1 Tax=Pacificoceanicola onchidii TaxID=2562685 RepID=UPI0010A5E094|nr:tripartite tricarboxylate transporter substrate-binding protein [Pacificoceanicola onchidii]
MNELTGYLKKLVTIGTLALMPMAAFADEDYPSRPITHVFPWGTSSPTFAASQIIATAMGEELGVAINTVSMTGASGMNAFKTALAEPADGYTLIDGYLAPLVIAPMNGNADHSYTDFIPLHFGVSNAFAIISRADEDRWTDFPSLIQYLKDNPGTTRYSGGPEVALPHMVGAMVMRHNDTLSRHIPYSATADGVKDLRAGIIDWVVTTPGAYRANESHVRVEAVLTDANDAQNWYGGAPLIHEFMPEFPLRGLGSVGWTWWVVKAGTPDAIVEQMRDAQFAAMQREDVRQKVADLGFVMNGYTADQYEEVVGPVEEMLQAATDALTWEKEALENN